MSGKQILLKVFYPVLVLLGKLTGMNREARVNRQRVQPLVSVYDYVVNQSDGSKLPLLAFRGKKLLLVNTASECGYTAQYAELQKLAERYQGSLGMIAFPANDFGGQEPGSNDEIARFCQLNYGIGFPLSEKTVVVRSEQQEPVFRWLTNAGMNGWNDRPPAWNFTKYLVDESGVLLAVWGPAVSPMDSAVLSLIESGMEDSRQSI